MNSHGKIPPQSPEIEKAVLGSLMLESDAYQKVVGIIDTESFYVEKHKLIFNTIKSLASKNAPIDLMMVTRELIKAGKMDEIGGTLYITQLTSAVASVAHLEHHARIIAQCHMQREVIKTANELLVQAYENEDIDTLMDSFRTKMSAIEDNTNRSSAGHSQTDVIESAVRELEYDCQLALQGKIPGIPTGFNTLDKITGGWRKTNLIVLASRPGIGKTSLALHFVLHASMAGYWVNFYTLEMTREDIMRINFSQASGVSRTIIRDGRLNETDWDRINFGITQIEKLPIRWYDDAGITAQQIRANTIKNKKNGKCDFVVIDYLQLVQPADKKANREQQISEMSRSLKKTALGEKIPIMYLAQLNRNASEEKPQLHHLRESGSIEQDADIVILPFRDMDQVEYDPLGQYTISMAKNRRGGKGSFPIKANAEMTQFGDIEIERIGNYSPNKFTESVSSGNGSPF